jgi:UDP-glucose 4-epimerase
MYLFGTDYPTRDGTCVRDYIHVDDLVEAHVLALAYLRGGGKSDIFNCGYGRGYSVREVIDSMKRVSGVDFSVELKPRRPGDAVEVWADTTKVTNVLGWKPRYADLDLICKTAYEWERTYKP